MDGKNILLIDDNKVFLSELGMVLTDIGYNSITVDDYLNIANAVNGRHIDVILLDLNMPSKNGFQVAFELSRSSQFQNVPIIAMTGFFRENYRFLFSTCGIVQCLRKPFSAHEVTVSIEDALLEKQRRLKEKEIIGAAKDLCYLSGAF